jgi:CcmD family protein
MNTLHLLLAQVGTGRIQGGWSYVWVCYAITWIGISGYAVSLFLRRRSALKDASK